MSDPDLPAEPALDLPGGQEVELEFVREAKPVQRGVLPQPLDDTRPGFDFIEVRVPAELGFSEPFRLEQVRKWVNLSTVAEVRFLRPGSLLAELHRLQALHQQVQRRLERR